MMTAGEAGARFRAGYAAQRAAEGRAHDAGDLRALPYLTTGPLARQWSVRARTFDAFLAQVLWPAMRERAASAPAHPVRVLDLGAGCGWLARRVVLAGGEALALDLRDDAVDGLGAAARFGDGGAVRFERVAASFDALPLRAAHFDLVVFNASLHYALDLAAVLAEARRAVRAGGRIAVLDSPFYSSTVMGDAMVAEKHGSAVARFGDRAAALLALPFVEYLTRDRLTSASAGLGIVWRRRRVRYPLWYELRPLVAGVRGRRHPSRFDLWEALAA